MFSEKIPIIIIIIIIDIIVIRIFRTNIRW